MRSASSTAPQFPGLFFLFFDAQRDALLPTERAVYVETNQGLSVISISGLPRR
ncbi:MAG: hypothetical protein AMXMBFR34_54090 [Myxococcaceae bacterium]